VPRYILHQKIPSKSFSLGARRLVTPEIINGLLRCVYNLNCKYTWTMIDTRVTSIISNLKQRISAKLYFPSTSYSGETLSANGVPTKLYIADLSSDHGIGVRFMEVLMLNRSSGVCCKCGTQMCLSVDRSVNFV
jgi:hypothetical protein